jgi:hypothetical protein
MKLYNLFYVELTESQYDGIKDFFEGKQFSPIYAF